MGLVAVVAMLGCELLGRMLFAVVRHAVLSAGWLVAGIVSPGVEFGLRRSVGFLTCLCADARLLSAWRWDMVCEL